MNTTLAVAHDSSAEEIREAVLSIANHSFDGFIGDLQVSREVNGAEGLQAYRYLRQLNIRDTLRIKS